LAITCSKKAIDDQTGVWHRRLEEDVKKYFGIDEKPQGMKSYQFLEYAQKEQVNKFEEEKKALQEKTGGTDEMKKKYEGEIESLKSQLKDAGLKGSELLKQDIDGYKNRIKDYENLVEDLKTKSAKDRKDLEIKIQGAQKQNLILEVGFERAQALTGVEFDNLVDEGIRDTFIDSKWNELLSTYTPEKDETGKTQWRDSEGKLVRDETKGMELATTKDLLMKNLQPILKKGRQQGGAGTSGGTGGGGSFLDLRGAKTQVEADDAIAKHLLSQGLQRATKEFATKQAEIRKENGVEKLPLT